MLFKSLFWVVNLDIWPIRVATITALIDTAMDSLRCKINVIVITFEIIFVFPVFRVAICFDLSCLKKQTVKWYYSLSHSIARSYRMVMGPNTLIILFPRWINVVYKHVKWLLDIDLLTLVKEMWNDLCFWQYLHIKFLFQFVNWYKDQWPSHLTILFELKSVTLNFSSVFTPLRWQKDGLCLRLRNVVVKTTFGSF